MEESPDIVLVIFLTFENCFLHLRLNCYPPIFKEFKIWTLFYQLAWWQLNLEKPLKYGFKVLTLMRLFFTRIHKEIYYIYFNILWNQIQCQLQVFYFTPFNGKTCRSILYIKYFEIWLYFEKKKNEIGKAARIRHHPPRVRSVPAAISGSWTSGTLCLAPLSFPGVAGWIAGSRGSLKPNLFSAEREPARLTCHTNSPAEVTSICSSTKQRRERLVRELDSCLLSAETSRTSWICCVLISVGPCRGSARLTWRTVCAGQILPEKTQLPESLAVFLLPREEHKT